MFSAHARHFPRFSSFHLALGCGCEGAIGKHCFFKFPDSKVSCTKSLKIVVKSHKICLKVYFRII